MKTTIVLSAFGKHCFTSCAAGSKSFRAVRLALLCYMMFGSVPPIRAQQNTPPTISSIPDQVTDEDVPLAGIPFTVRDAETPPDQLRISPTSTFSDGSFIIGGVVISGAGTDRWLSVFPPADKSGTMTVKVEVRDASGLSASTVFRVEVRPVNDPSQMSAIADQVALKGQGLFQVPFSAFDVESLSQINLRAWSSRQAVVGNSGLRIVPGFGVSNRVLQITLGSQGAAGSTAITVQADDRQTTNRVSFILNVVEPEFARVNSQLPSAQNFQPAWGDFNGDGLLDLLVSPTQIWTNRGSGVLVPGIELPGGTGVTGAVPADFDGDGNLDLLLLGSSVRLLRNNGANPPVFSEVPLPRRFFEGAQAFWADVDGDGDLDILPRSINSQANWLRNDGRYGFVGAFFGVTPNVAATVLAVGDFDNDGDPDLLVTGVTTEFPGLRLYANDGTGRFQEVSISLPQGITRSAGWVDVDGDGFLDLRLVQASSSNSPTNTLVVLRQLPGRFTETFRLSFPIQNSDVAITNLAWADFDNDGRVDFAGPFIIPAQPGIPRTNFTTIYHNDGTGRFTATGLPASLERGQLLPVVGDFDDDGSADLLYRSTSLLALRNQAHAINSLPGAPPGLHASVADNLVTLIWNDAIDGNQTAALTYNVRVGTAPGWNDVVPSMSTTNGVRMIPAPGNAGFNSWMELKLPFDQLTVEVLYWSVQAVDASFQGGPFAAEQTFQINPPGNQPPVITGISDLTIPKDTTITLTLHVTDDRTAPGLLRVLASASNTNLFPSANVKLSRFILTKELKVDLSLVPRAEQSGLSMITVTATDRGGLSTSRSFFVTVTPVSNPPVLTAADSLLALRPAGPGGFELELRTTPTNSWKVETSEDLVSWQEYSTTGAAMQTTTNGVNRLSIGATSQRQFFRARQIE